MKIDKLEKCRICGSEVELVYDFGEIYISGFVKPGEDSPKAPMTVVECKNCGLVQLGETVDLDFLYKKQYWYMSALNKSMVASLKDIVDKTLEKITLKAGDVVVDLGMNDGTLFTFYPDNVVRVGFEPASNIHETARGRCDYFIGDYFTADAYPKFLDKAKIVSSIAMFYDLESPGDFIEDVKEILDDEGIWVIQLTDLTSVLQMNEVTSVGHEHLSYYKLYDLSRLMLLHGLEIFDVEYNKTNGRSLRLYIGYPEKHIWSRNVYTATLDEGNFYSNNPNAVKDLFTKTVEVGNKVKKYLETCKDAGIPVYGLGASTKGNTLLQYFGIDNTLIKAIGEVNADKFGLVTAGSQIPIISEKEMMELNPPIIFLIIWQFRDNILEKLKDYIQNGGLVLLPLPEPCVLGNLGLYVL